MQKLLIQLVAIVSIASVGMGAAQARSKIEPNQFTMRLPDKSEVPLVLQPRFHTSMLVAGASGAKYIFELHVETGALGSQFLEYSVRTDVDASAVCNGTVYTSSVNGVPDLPYTMFNCSVGTREQDDYLEFSIVNDKFWQAAHP